MLQNIFIYFRNAFLLVFVLGVLISISNNFYTPPYFLATIVPVFTLFLLYLLLVAASGLVLSVVVENWSEIEFDSILMFLVILILSWLIGIIFLSIMAFFHLVAPNLVFPASVVVTLVFVGVLSLLPLERFLI